MTQFLPPNTEVSIRKQIAEQNHVSESYVSRSEKFMKRRGDHGRTGTRYAGENSVRADSKVRDADMHRLAKADYIRPASRSCTRFCTRNGRSSSKPSYSHNWSTTPEPGKSPCMADSQKIESVYDSDAYPKEVRYDYVALEHVTTRFRTEFDYLLRTMPDTAQREVILEIIHKHKEYLASLESALAEDEQTA